MIKLEYYAYRGYPEVISQYPGLNESALLHQTVKLCMVLTKYHIAMIPIQIISCQIFSIFDLQT